VDPPDDRAGGVWWIDIKCDDGFLTPMSWTQGVGFGAFTDEPLYGGRPDNLFQQADMAARWVFIQHGQWKTSGSVAALWLSHLRALTGTPQTQLAAALNRNQPAISKLETRGDVKLSSLVAYVTALGGRVDLRVRFDDWEAAIGLPKGER